MGKDLKGRELGVGLSQLKNGLYTARYTDTTGKRQQLYSKNFQECRKWLANAPIDNDSSVSHMKIYNKTVSKTNIEKISVKGIINFKNMTVEQWFMHWLAENKKFNLRAGTKNTYINRYNKNIKEYLGNMRITEVKPIHCQNVMNGMADKYAIRTMRITKAVMHEIFEYAVENDIIEKNPVCNIVKCGGGRKPKPERVLTLNEQREFLKAAEKSNYYNQFLFILQTGLRVGELTGLKWSDIDMDNKVIHIQRTMGYIVSKGWIVNDPKTKSGNRKVPLTKEAIRILNEQKIKHTALTVIPIEYSDYVFTNTRGKPISANNYDYAIRKICKKINIPYFSMHILRHTFATRCIEAGMQPKTLQVILGHSNINLTMNLYVHVTDDEKVRELELIEDMLKVI